MKRAAIILFTVLFVIAQAKAFPLIWNDDTDNEESYITKEVSILDGSIVIEMFTGGDFHCIGIHFTDRILNTGLGTCLEMKKRGEFYIVEIDYERREYPVIDQAIEDYIRDLFFGFYEEDEKEHGEKIWESFVKEGGLQLFIDIVKEFADEEFLSSPFNEQYG